MKKTFEGGSQKGSSTLLKGLTSPFRFVYKLGRPFRSWSAPRLGALIAIFVLLLSVVMPLFHPQAVKAFSTYNQTDWSGGTGSDPTNQYTFASNIVDSTPGQVTLDSTISNWCNTAHCDNNWGHRKIVDLNNYSGPEYTDHVVKIHITADGANQPDFDDVRFVSSDGTTDYPQYLLDKQDSNQADFFVKIPDIPASSVFEFYYYFGNNGAASVNDDSVVTFADDFSTGSLGSQWDNTNQAHYSISNGEMAVDAGTSLQMSGSFDLSDDRIMELDIKVDMANFVCPGNLFSYVYDLFVTDSTTIGFSGYAQDCQNHPDYYFGNNNGNPTIDGNTWVRFRVARSVNGFAYYYYSLDGGITYTEFNGVQSDAGNTKLLINGYQAPFAIRNVLIYSAPNSELPTAFGIDQPHGGKYGAILSAAYDMGGTGAQLGHVNIDYTGTGIVGVVPFTSSNGSINTDPRFCPILSSGAMMTDSSCVHEGDRYVFILLLMSEDSGGNLTLNDINFEYDIDVTPPTTNASDIVVQTSSSGDIINPGEWTRTAEPYFSWTAAQDNLGGSGIKGYCLYLGNDSGGDPVSSKGIFTASSPLDTGGACQYAISGTNVQIDNSMVDNGALTNVGTYYLNIKAIDNVNQVFTGPSATASYKLDNNPPQVGTLFNVAPVSNTKAFSFTWLTQGALIDNQSGAAGFKYCVTNASIGFSGCDPSDHNWFGKNHTSGDIRDPSDVIPFSDGIYTMQPADYSRIDDNGLGINAVSVIAVDNVGNFTPPGVFGGTVVVTHMAPSAPINLAANPTSSTVNNFSFTWDPPSQAIGPTQQVDYCWTVNEAIAADASNCHWTGQGITQLAAGPYATQQGNNTLYLMAKDQTTNFDHNNVATVTFSASTAAPGGPTDAEISDVSTKATSTWRLALSWAAPSAPGAGVSSYRIYRSTDNSNFSQVGSTSNSNLSFIDSGLSQVTYYYYIKACDNAGSCGVASNTVSKTPTGRFTVPAKLTADSDQPKTRDVGTRKATVYWFTDRASDSKVAIGTSPGQYAPDETGNSSQTANHSVNLTNLQPGTTYYYVAKWTDQDGNTGQSTERSFITSPAPSVSEVNTDHLTIGSAVVNFKTKDASQAKIYYGNSEAFGAAKTINTSAIESSYSFNLGDLNDGTKYFFKINTFDSDGNEYQGNVYIFTTPARPKITNLRFQPVDGSPSSTQKITWNTNVAATSGLSYGPKDGKQQEVIDSKLVTDHELVISGLDDDTEYTLVARSADAAGNTATSDVQNFKTALDTRPPKITDVNIETTIRGTGGEARGQIVVSWKTDEKATSQVAFGQGQTGAFTNRTSEDGNLTTDHVVIVSDLPVSSIYHVEAISQDKSHNVATSDPQSAIIGRGSENIFSIVFNALQKIFGVGG